MNVLRVLPETEAGTQRGPVPWVLPLPSRRDSVVDALGEEGLPQFGQWMEVSPMGVQRTLPESEVGTQRETRP